MRDIEHEEAIIVGTGAGVHCIRAARHKRCLATSKVPQVDFTHHALTLAREHVHLENLADSARAHTISTMPRAAAHACGTPRRQTQAA
jgi:hypothetical protein